MKILMLFVVCMCSLMHFSFTQEVEQNAINACSITRYITDIKNADKDVKEISVNMLFQINESNESGNFKFNLPDAEKILVTNYSVKIFDGDGNLISKDKHRKISISEFNDFNPKFIASKYLGYSKPLSIEWDYKLVVYSPKGELIWPSISGTYHQIDEVSLRLNFYNPDDFDYSSNMEVGEETDLNYGGSYYLWSIKKLTNSSGEFNGENIKSPYVRIIFK
ncbi:MAG: hypothetical protein AB7S48_13315 [Bacteroidales bacterium]